MFDLVEFEQICSMRDYLAGAAIRHMGHTFQNADVEDVINTGLLAAWQYRDRIETTTRGFAVGCVVKSAAKWCQKQIIQSRRIGEPESEIVNGRKDEHSWRRKFTGCHMMTRDEAAFIDHRTPEVEFIAKVPVDQINQAVQRLTPVQRRHYDEWVDRDYRNLDHAQECAVSRCKAAIRVSLVKQKVMKAAA